MNQIEKIIDIATWNRKEHFEHFSAFDDPFFGVTVHVDCTRSYQEAKDKGVSFSLLLLHRIITAASKVEEFRYRIEGDKVVCYDSLLPEARPGRQRPKPALRAICLRPYRPARWGRERANFRFSMLSFCCGLVQT